MVTEKQKSEVKHLENTFGVELLVKLDCLFLRKQIGSNFRSKIWTHLGQNQTDGKTQTVLNRMI